jgi:hypothetical protein
MALGSIQPLTKMNTRNHPGNKGRPELEADNLTAIEICYTGFILKVVELD